MIWRLIRRLLHPKPRAPFPIAPPLPWGTILIDGPYPIVADGKGGMLVMPYTPKKPSRASRRRTG